MIYREDINREDFFFSSLRRMIDNRLHIYGRRVNFDIWYIRFPENRLTTFLFFFFAIVIISTFAPRFDKYRGRKSRGEKKYCSNFKLVDFGTKTKATMGWKKIYLVASIFFSIRCSTRTYSLQRCRFSTRTILLCASSCRQLSSRFIRGHVLPPGIFYRNLNLPCKPALHTQGTVRSNIRPIFAYREKYIYKR